MRRRDLLSGTLAPALLAQKEPPAQEPTFSTGIKVVNVLATVREKTTGNLVTTLGKDDFDIDDERVPQRIRYFAAQSDLPLTVGLVVDTSGSQERLLPAQQEAAAVFVERMIRESVDSVFVVKFDRYVSLVRDVTQSKAALRKALPLLKTSPRPKSVTLSYDSVNTSRLFDAVATSCERFLERSEGRRVLIVISDGVDTGGRGHINTAVEAAIRAETVVFSICYRDPAATNPAALPEDPLRPRSGTRILPDTVALSGKDNLAKLALETGGSFFEVVEETPVGQVFRAIEEELRAQYNIGFTPENSGPARFHRVRLKVRKPGFEVRSRAGYYFK